MTRKNILTGMFVGMIALSQLSSAGPAAAPKYIDGEVTARQIQTKLQSEGFSPITKIDVEADDEGVVTLKGIAVSDAEATRAFDIAKETDGVMGVKSQIYVKRLQ